MLQVEELESESGEKQEQSKKNTEEENLLSEYEQQRLKRIEENTRTLVQLVIIFDNAFLNFAVLVLFFFLRYMTGIIV